MADIESRGDPQRTVFPLIEDAQSKSHFRFAKYSTPIKNGRKILKTFSIKGLKMIMLVEICMGNPRGYIQITHFKGPYENQNEDPWFKRIPLILDVMKQHFGGECVKDRGDR